MRYQLRKYGLVAVFLSTLSLSFSAFAWTREDCVRVNYDHPDCGKYKPTPQPTPTPAPVIVSANPSADADAAAKAAAAAISKSLAQGGNATGGDAKAISDNWNRLSSDQQQKLMATLSNEQRQALSASLNNVTTANGGAGGNAAGGDAAGGNASGQGSGNSTVTNTTTNTSYRQVSVLPLFMPTPSSVVASGPIVTERTNCGPVMGITRKDVKGTHIGFWSNTLVDLGEDMEAVPVIDPKTNEQVMFIEREFMENGNRVVRRFGSQLFFVYALPTVSAASSFSIGGAGANGGGNAGGGASSAMNRIVTKVQIVSCEIAGGYRIEEVPPPVPPITKNEAADATAMAQALLSSMKWVVDVPTQRVVTEERPCKMEPITRADGTKETRCLGSKSGKYKAPRVIDERVTASGRLDTGTKAATEKK